jgi:hypothetical protein
MFPAAHGAADVDVASALRRFSALFHLLRDFGGKWSYTENVRAVNRRNCFGVEQVRELL